MELAMDGRRAIAVLGALALLAILAGAAAAAVGVPFDSSTADADPCVINSSDPADNTTHPDDDCDGLGNAMETEHGLDPQAADTDDDGIEDRDELLLTRTDAQNPDTDGDGVLDGEEDPDGDGLTIAEEVEVGSHPRAADGDADGLADPREIELGTEPLRADTDEDGLHDGAELELETDPLDPDSDDDGVDDGNETYRTSTRNDQLGVQFTVEGAGNIAEDVDIERTRLSYLRNPNVDRARVTPMIDLRTDRSFERGTLTFEYDEDSVENESEIAVFRWDQSVGTWVPMDTEIHEEDDTVQAEVSDSGTFVAFQLSKWIEIFEGNTPPGGDGGTDQ